MTQHLVITAVGTDRPGICNEVVRLVTQAGCNIIDSRIALFGKEFTLLMLISGSPSNITRVETTLPLLGQQHDLITMMKRTSPHDHQTHAYTVEVYVESDDKMGLTEKFTQFFAQRQIGMASLSAQTISKDKLQSEKISSTSPSVREWTQVVTLCSYKKSLMPYVQHLMFRVHLTL